MHMAALSLHYEFPKIRFKNNRNISSCLQYRNILHRDPSIVIRIVSLDSCQYTALVAKIAICISPSADWGSRLGALLAAA